jgi:DNA polymerase III delta prime subunit
MGEKTFAAKLAAFMLNGLSYEYVIKCKKQGGFDASSQEVLGLLPFVHMNITKGHFTQILYKANGDMHKAMALICKAKKFDQVLKKVDFKCGQQTGKAIEVLIERIVDTIEVAYNTRRSGKKHARELAAHMRWQVKNNIIPESSIAWCEGLKSASKVEPV